MKLLLDTHVLLWTLQDSPELTDRARYLIEDEGNEIYYSIISLWEIQIKHMKHPKEMLLDASALENYCKESGFHVHGINRTHVSYLEKLKEPEDGRHKDPFDRMMICQAAVDGMLFLTRDKQIVRYDESCIYDIS